MSAGLTKQVATAQGPGSQAPAEQGSMSEAPLLFKRTQTAALTIAVRARAARGGLPHRTLRGDVGGSGLSAPARGHALLRNEQAALDGHLGGLGLRADVELAVDVLDVGVHGSVADM